MTQETSAYLSATVNGLPLAIPLEAVLEVIQMPQATAVPRVSPCVRGVINVRGKIIQLLDLRLMLGMESLRKQFTEVDEILQARMEDHRKWITELESSIRENRPFRLPRDPHMCAFGKWYDTYKPYGDSIAFMQFWRSMDAPHRAIHRIADVALGLVSEGKTDQAIDVIDKTRQGQLSDLLGLLTSAADVMHENSRELAVLLKMNGQTVAVSMDKADTVVRIPDTEVQPLPENMLAGRNDLVTRGIKQPNSPLVRMMLEVEPLFSQVAA